MADDLLAGALQAAARLGIARFGPLAIDVRALTEADMDGGLGGDGGDPADGPGLRPSYSEEVAALFDRAAGVAREDGEPKVRLVHLLAAFGPWEEGLMGRLKREHHFDGTGWRMALSEWDQTRNASAPQPPEGRSVLSVDDAATVIGVHAQTIRGYIRSGKLPAYRVAGERAIRVFASDVYGLLEPLEPDSGGETDEG